jgi:hypothetical protein
MFSKPSVEQEFAELNSAIRGRNAYPETNTTTEWSVLCISQALLPVFVPVDTYAEELG